VTSGVLRRSAARLGIVLAILVVTFGVVAVPAAAAADRLPDLRVAPISDLRITTSNGHRYLRFTSLMMNLGAGAFEVRASRPNTSTPWTVEQVIYDDAGGTRRVESDATLRYAGDGHGHWHVRRMMAYHLWSTRGTWKDAKIGFCFFDTTPRDLSLPGAPQSAYYRESWCGGSGATSTRTGISVGWGDRYPWSFVYQWIDITGVPGGTYTLRNVVDLYDSFDEGSETNNCRWARISFSSSGTTVRVVETGTTCINDHSTTTYASSVAWAYAQGITGGCDADLFCTYNPVTRGQFAAFLARTMQLPAATRDYFSDDNGSTYEPSINKIAEAGITGGCAPGRYCPSSRMTRGQAASMFVRALGLPRATHDYFSDDNGTTHERAINSMAEAGLVAGCAPERYCPTASLTRGQTVALLRRAFGT
jgi:hypothetical protein